MNNTFKPGDKKYYEHKVREEDSATFESGQIHPVYSTFALARDAEWTCRLFVLQMKDTDEEGIGTFISVEHQSPALIGDKVGFEATVDSINGNELICSYEAKVGSRVIATGRQGQKILKKEKIKAVFDKIRHG